MIRKIFVGIALLVCAFSFGQSGSASPYSFFGIGETRFRGVVENQTMGGISVFADSVSLNLKNPAAYGRLKLTAYTAAASFNGFRFEDDNATENSFTAAFEYLALGFPISKRLGFGFGVLPFTSVGYELESLDESGDLAVLNQFTGEGGVNKAFLSVGYGITENLSIGVTGNYDFGKIDNENLQVIESVELAAREVNEATIKGFDVNFALNYRRKIAKNLMLQSSVIYAPQATLSSDNEQLLETVSLLSGTAVVIESEQIDLGELQQTDVIIPENITFGLGLGKQNKWFVGAEYEIKQTGDFENTFFDISSATYEDGSRFAVGGFYIPKYNSFTSYWSRVVYRAGLRYEETGLVLNNIPINDFGISFGLSLPVGASKVNVGFELGRRGTTTAGRIEETYFNLNVSLTLVGKWFRKIQYN